MTITYRTACSASKSAGSVSSTTLAYASAVSAGDTLMLVARFGDDTGSDVLTVSDSVNGSWGTNKGYKVFTGLGGLAVFALANSAAGTPTVTVSQTSTTTLRLAIAACGGLDTTTPLDVSDISATGNSTAPTSATVTPTTASSLAWGVMAGNTGTPTVSAGTGYTLDQVVDTDKLANEFQVLSSATALNASFGLTGSSDDWICGIFVFKAASGSGVSKNLTAQTATFTEGTLTRAVSYALTGRTATFTEGTISASTGGNVTLSLSGQSITSSEGTVSPNIGYLLDDGIGLGGQVATFTEGSPTETISYALTGQTATASEGTASPAVNVFLTAQTASFTEGTISRVGDVTIQLTALQATFSEGLLSIGSLGAGRHRKWYGVRQGGKLLVFDSKAKADAADAALRQQAGLPPPKNLRRKIKVREMPAPHEVIPLFEAERLAREQHEANTYHELMAAHAYTSVIQLYHEMRRAQQIRQAEEEEIAMILMHL